jgi:protein required for attachment to host cells
MRTLWIVIADSLEASIYRSTPATTELALETRLEHPEAKLYGRDLVTDRPGTHTNSRSPRTNTLERTPPLVVEREKFAHRLAAFLDDAVAANRVHELALVMAPQLLGAVRAHMKAHTLERIVCAINHRKTDADLAEVVAEVRAQRTPAPLM